MLDLKCPHCGSEHTQKITSIVEAGTTSHKSTTSSTSAGMGMVGGKMAYGSGTTTSTTRGTSTTALAASLGEPMKRPVIGMAWTWFRYSVAGFLLTMVLAATVLNWIFPKIANSPLLMLAVFLAIVAFGVKCFLDAIANQKWNADEYPDLIKRWMNGYFCHRCETIYVPTEQ